MSKGPSKLLYTAGGWFLGGIAGGLIGAAVIFGAATIGVTAATMETVFLVAQIISFTSSVLGAAKGWQSASKAQTEYSAQAQATAYQSTRSQDFGMGAPQRSAEIDAEQPTRNNWADSVSERRDLALANGSIER